ncbi:MAG: cytochrome-c peroxidase [Flavobacterium sp.]|uniref:cytochrome-c peroxidase n=1 Tax=Flavobacterium sp. TaxID=239 RepID=UPI00120E4B13|nr:cytochrome c peroxidase [Flavobacterium sp.]RZJ66752.1 MAG: cytochrome-c peroxidase [Flavobacterium sp.]
MKKDIILLILFISGIIALWFSGSSFSSDADYSPVNTFLSTSNSDLMESVKKLDEAAHAFHKNPASGEDVKKAIAQTRLDYKKVEFYLAFYYPEFTTGYLNGAPLLQPEAEGNVMNIKEPEGLQVLDEMAGMDDAELKAERSKLVVLTQKLVVSYGMLFNGLQKRNYAQFAEIDAMRLQLIRIFSLGVSGFDTPGTLNGIAESAVSLEGMRTFFKLQSGQSFYADIDSRFEAAIDYLNANPDFNSFDRLAFFKQHIDPLYKALGKTGLARNPDVDLEKFSSWNPRSESIFDADFLNPYFFTELTKIENNAALETLGKKLFYDKNLSSDGKMNCASCHNPQLAFTDGKPKSESNVSGKTVLRNSPTLLNSVYADRYFYDLRAFGLEQQAEHVLFNKEEFNTHYQNILDKLNSDVSYSELSKKALKKNKTDRDVVIKALSSYVLSLQSHNSAFDRFARGETSQIPDDVYKGFNLFMGKANCATCHFVPTFSGLVPPLYNENESEVLGLQQHPKTKLADTDLGRINNKTAVEKNAWIFNQSFKTVTVRNSGLTAPYFHNGAYSTLEEVMDFYNKGGGLGLGLPVSNQTLSGDALDLSENEVKQVIAFLNALSDNPYAEQKN